MADPVKEGDTKLDAKPFVPAKAQSFFQAHKEAIILVGAAFVLFLAALFLG